MSRAVPGWWTCPKSPRHTARRAPARPSAWRAGRWRLIRAGQIGKGDVLAVAQVAGIMAAKKNAELIPMCHPLLLTKADITFQAEDEALHIFSEIRCRGETGVEMEALTAVSVAALTVYDMCKAVQRDMVITDVRLLYKDGGKSGTYEVK